MTRGEAYTAWLRQRGVPEAEIGVHQRIASQLMSDVGDGPVRPFHVDEAMKRAEAGGATAHQLASFKRLADVFVAFDREWRGKSTARAAPSPSTRPPASPKLEAPEPSAAPVDDLELGELVPSGAAAMALEDEGVVGEWAERAEQRPIAVLSATRACPACGGAVELDYGQSKLTGLGGVGAVVAAGTGFLFGCLGSLSLVLFGAAVASFVGLVLATQRCAACGRKANADELTPREIAEIRDKRLKLGSTSVLAGIGGSILLFVWLAAAASSASDPREAELVQAVASVSTRLRTDHTLHELARLTDPSLGNEAVIATFFGGTYAASAPSPPDGIGYCPGQPTRTFCVVVRRGDAPHDIVVEGYGEDLVTPLEVETVVVGP